MAAEYLPWAERLAGRRKRKGFPFLLFAWSLAFLHTLPLAGCTPGEDESPYRIYVMLGLHMSFAHSWRGNAPDETGFGTDLRVSREVLRLLNDANEQGLDAKVYWDFSIHWTLEKFLADHGPDIIAQIRDRVERGLDEVLPGSYNNGVNSAATAKELATALEWAMENPFHSGLEQVFGQATPIHRPQEAFFTTGHLEVMKRTGMEGIILPYSTVPFTSFSNFVPPLALEDRFRPLWIRASEEGPRLPLLLSLSLGDLVSYISLENLMLRLRRHQVREEILDDLLIHINFDADAESWLPIARGVPNLGGIPEYVRAVNKFPWAHFTTPGRYLKDHPPHTEVTVRQDLADGAFDGYYSWAEKASSHAIWTDLEKSRLFSYQADGFRETLSSEIDASLWEGPDSCFYQRLIGLSATHFGMATPVLDAERLKEAREISRAAKECACEQLVEAARSAAVRSSRNVGEEAEAEYVFRVFNYVRGESGQISRGLPALVRIPVILEKQKRSLVIRNEQGESVPFSVLNPVELSRDEYAAELFLVLSFEGDRTETSLFLSRVPHTSGQNHTLVPSLRRIANPWIDIQFDEKRGIRSFLYQGAPLGDEGFLDPFVSYRPDRGEPLRLRPQGYAFQDLKGEVWQGIQRAALQCRIPMELDGETEEVRLEYAFTLPEALPFVIADVEVRYPHTPREDLLGVFQTSLENPVDLRWVETAPFQVCPVLSAPFDRPFRVWKHNYLGITSFYELNYGDFNPKNRELASFNNHVTAGWVAVSNRSRGLLLAEDASRASNLAFAPMRLSMEKGMQRIRINPFGSYHGQQLDFSHLGGSRLASDLTLLVGAQFSPNGPSYNGTSLRFSLLVAPYEGDEPPRQLQEQADAFFHPYGVTYLKTPLEEETLIPEQMQSRIEERKKERVCSQAPRPVPTPQGLLARPASGSAHLVWNPPEDICITGFAVSYGKVGTGPWREIQTEAVPAVTVHGLEDGTRYAFKVRALAGSRKSPFSDAATCTIGARKRHAALDQLRKALNADPFIAFKILCQIVYYYLTTTFS